MYIEEMEVKDCVNSASGPVAAKSQKPKRRTCSAASQAAQDEHQDAGSAESRPFDY